jgi:hypothetical protein
VKALVVTLRAGEAEFEGCLAALGAQVGIEVDHVVFENLPNIEAHRRCFHMIESRSTEFDVAFKLDADMVLRGTGTMRAMADVLAEDPELDHVQFAVHDFYTERLIMGVQAYSPRVRWRTNAETLFVDPAPEVPGHRRLVWDSPAPVADHSPDPSPIQAFRFGVHRAQKAFQPGRERVRGSQARDQWRVLTATWEAFTRTTDLRHGLAVYGADLVWRGQIDVAGEGYRSSVVDTAFEAAPKDPRELRLLLARRWDTRLWRNTRRLAVLGPSGAARAAAAAFKGILERNGAVHVR